MVQALLSVDASTGAAGGLGLGDCVWAASILFRRRGTISAASIGVRQRIDGTSSDDIFHGSVDNTAVSAGPTDSFRHGDRRVRRAVSSGRTVNWSDRWKSWAAGIHWVENRKTLQH